ncbi:NAD(+)--arginine ADP-ribosyltransferase [Mycobacterium sp. ACS4054]|uniref:glycohydrolase toxin TNT-related protein n=1 Tax=Mycobacterium sp. ACS4054 TaxID=1834119 RepID=UPI0007FD0079|nr:glycohydrolase toxin TNT-related protein [Mycobacterium sp. ACS4054]OBF04706.1 NAD(+)--arginine ADP-ribosyltransferase [Mycobacterium sp. ACS4054]
MAPLACDPTALDRAGATVLAAGESLGSVISGLTAALAGSAGMAGDDPVGATVGRSYDGAAAKLIDAMTNIRNGLCSIGDGVRVSAHNYALAEALSDVTGRAGGLPTPQVTAPLIVGPKPPSAVGAGTGAPAGWGWVAPYIGMIWPSGDSAKLRAAAAAWAAAGANFMATETAAGGGTMAAIGAQQIPEGTAINKALLDASEATIDVARQCQTIAAQLSSYAAKVDKVHAAILDLLSRICDPLTGIKEVWDLLTDEDEDEIKRIADDIRTVVDNFAHEAETLGDQINATISAAAAAAEGMARWAGHEWDHFLHGTQVGRVLNHVGQTLKGVGVEGYDYLEGLNQFSLTRLQTDPVGFVKDTVGMVEGEATLAGLGPDGLHGAGEAWKALGKQVTHWDEWASHPDEAFGKSLFDIATLAVPGGPLSKLGKWGRGMRDALRGLREGRLPEGVKPPSEPPRTEPPPAGPKPPEGSQPAPPGKPEPGRPAPPASGKPAPAPADGPLPHSPTESKPPVGEKHPAGEAPKPIAAPPEAAGKPGASAPAEQAPLPHPKPAEPAPAHVPPSPGGAPVPSAGLPSPPEAPHLPTPPSAPMGGAPAEASLPLEDAPHAGEPGARPPEPQLPHDGAPPGDGGDAPHPPSDGPPEPAAGDKSPGSHLPHDGTPPDDDADEHRLEVPSVADLKPWHQAQLALAESPERLVKDLLEHGCPPEIAESAAQSPYEGMTAQEILERYWDPARRTWDWPKVDGFADRRYEIARSIPKETWLDRIGEVSGDRGDYMAAEGDPYPDRGLAPGSSGDYNRFHGTGKELPEGWQVRHGKVGDAFGQPGGGTQWVVVDKNGKTVLIKWLLENGYLAKG